MEQKILSQFLHNHKLKFNEIEKGSKIRSNKLSYHLKKLKEKGTLEKVNNFYRLSENSENLIPYLTDKQFVLPVILIKIKNKNKIFLHKRNKRPYKDFLSLPGGRIFIGETVKKTTERIMKEKFNINCRFKKVNSISIENVKKNKKIVHSFLLILVTATTNDKIAYTDIKEQKEKIIKSDYLLLNQGSNFEVKINNILSRV